MWNYRSAAFAASARGRGPSGQFWPTPSGRARRLLSLAHHRPIRTRLRTVVSIVEMLFVVTLCVGDCWLPVARALRDGHNSAGIAGRGYGLPDPWVSDRPTIRPHAASGATVTFWTQNGRTVDGVPPRMTGLPHLVLYRNGALTDPDERTLIVEVSGIRVPPEGVTVTLAAMTQRPDPDERSGSDARIPVWHASQRIAGRPGTTRIDGTAVFTREFTGTVTSGTQMVPTPTDYFRVDVTAGDGTSPPNAPWHTFRNHYAFLMENQWIAQLPEVPEESPGAAPDELIVHYCDMFPFGSLVLGPSSRPYRREVPGFVQHELVPRMIEAYRLQTEVWGFPWPDAWTSLRPEDGEERLSVALSDSPMWYHGMAPGVGRAQISLDVSGRGALCETLIDGLVGTFHHELFHNIQRGIHRSGGGDGALGGRDDAWQFFSEGMAVLASSVGQPRGHITLRYMWDANRFQMFNSYSREALPHDSAVQLLSLDPKSYATMRPYAAVMFWRFLYEQCGGMRGGIEDPAAGMEVARQALTVLYSGEIVDIARSTDLVAHLPALMDRALVDTACPFETYEQSLVHLSRAIYALRLEGGRCAAPGLPTGCGFYDPDDLYMNPPVRTVTYTGADQEIPLAIRSSFGMAFVDVLFDPAVHGQSLTIEFAGVPGADAEFRVQVWKLIDAGPDARPRRIPAQALAPELIAGEDADGRLVTTIPAIDMAAFNQLGLIITRIDARESEDPIGEYNVRLRPGLDEPGQGGGAARPGRLGLPPASFPKPRWGG